MTPALRDYQRVGVDHLHSNPRAGLFMDMGLGKTATVLSALTPDHLPALVVAPKRVAETVWPEERQTWRPDLTMAVAAGRKDQRSRVLGEGHTRDLTVLGRDNLSDLLEAPFPWRTVVLDELSSFKTRGTLRWKILRKVLADVPHVWGLTGTPSPNGLMDLWAQMYLLDGGKRLGTTLTGFRNRYFIPGRRLSNGIVATWEPRPETEAAIHRLLEDICLSMATDGRVTLPPVTFNQVAVELPPNARRAYKTLKRDLVVNLDMCGVLGEIHSADTAAALSNRLSQISAGFLYPDERWSREPSEFDVIHHAKTTALREVIDGTGSPVLVFYRYQAEKAMIIKELGPCADVKDPGAIQAWNRGELPVMLAHPASAGHGLNLQHGGHTIVWTSLPWSLEEWEQSNKRLARSGQKHPVVIHLLMAKGTVDPSILRALEDKASVQDALLAHLESPL